MQSQLKSRIREQGRIGHSPRNSQPSTHVNLYFLSCRGALCLYGTALSLSSCRPQRQSGIATSSGIVTAQTECPFRLELKRKCRCDMADPRTQPQLRARKDGALTKNESRDDEGQYAAVSPCGNRLPVPRGLFVALTDFMQTRKCAGSILIQFRTAEIHCMQPHAKNTYRNPLP